MSGIELARGETLADGSAGRKDEPPSLYSMLNVYRELMKGIARSPDFGADLGYGFGALFGKSLLPRYYWSCYLPPKTTPPPPICPL